MWPLTLLLDKIKGLPSTPTEHRFSRFYSCNKNSSAFLIVLPPENLPASQDLVGISHTRSRQSHKCLSCCLNQGKAGEIFYKHQNDISRSLALVLLGDFNLPHVCCQLNTVKRQSKGSWSVRKINS